MSSLRPRATIILASQLLARHWIDGEWDDARDRVESINPATGETIGAYTEAGEAEASNRGRAQSLQEDGFA